MRRRDAERHADGRGYQSRDDHQRQRLERRQPVALVHDEQQCCRDKDRQRQRAPQHPAQRRDRDHQQRCGNKAQQCGQAVDAAANQRRYAVEHHPAVGLDVIDDHGNGVAHRYFVFADPMLEAPRDAGGVLAGERVERRAAVEGVDAVEPGAHHRRIGLEPRGGRHFGRLVLIENRGHQLALALGREVQILQQPADVGALQRVAGARVGIDRGTAVVRSEHAVPARQIPQVEAHVHRVRVPGQEHDRRAVAISAFDLGQHALLARFDQFEVAQAIKVLLQHRQDQPVAVIARFDAEDRALELAREVLDVGERFQARVIGIGGHRQRVLGAGQVGADHFRPSHRRHRPCDRLPGWASSCPGTRRCPCSSSMRR